MTKHLRFLIVLLMTLVWSAGWAAEKTETINIKDYVPSSSYVQIPQNKPLNLNGFKIYIEDKSTNGNPGLYKRDSNLRFYTDDILHIESSNGDITSVEFTGTVSIIGLTSNTWSGTPSASVSFTGGSKTNKITVIKITYTESSSSNKTSTTLTFPKQSLTYATTDDLTSFTGQTATLTADETTLTGKTITYSKSGDDIFTSFDTTNGTLALNGNPGTATVTATFDGSNDDTYASSSASYTITVKEVIKDIATLKEKLTTSLQYFTLKLTDAIVTYKSGDNLYLQDKTGGIYCSGTTTLANKDKVNGLVVIRAYIYKGQRKITQFTLAEDATIENNVEFTPEVVTLAQLNENIDKYENMRVKVVAATATAAMNNNQTTITQDGASLVLYSKNTVNWDFVADDVLDIEGYPIMFTNGSTNIKELLVYNKSDVEINSSVVATTLSFDTETTSFNVEKNSEDKFVAPKAVVKDAADNVVAGAKITYKSDNDAVASVDENGNVTFGSAFGTATITASYAGDDTHKPATSIFYTITYSKIPTEMAWSESSVSVNIGELPSLPTLKLTAHGEDIRAGKTIKYSSSDESLVSIDEFSGKMHIDAKAGSTTITATFVGDDTYAAASAEYTLNVIDPNKTDFAFDFTKPESYGYAKPVSGGKTDLYNGDVLVSGIVTITNEKGASTTTRFKDDGGNVTFRVYTGAILTVEVPTGFAINRIDFTDDDTHKVDNFTFSTGELNLNTWTGSTKKLTMKVTNAQVFLLNMTVNLVKVENVTLNESEINTMEAKALANVTLKRSMVENEWNTICLPFNVTAEQAKTAFGEGVMIAQLNKNSSGNKLSFSSVDAIVASTPYLIKPTIAAPADGYKFEGVTINDDGKGNVAPNVVNTNSYLAFVGIYNTVDVTKNVTEVLNNNYYAAFLGANNTIFKAKNDGGKMKGFRAYFAIPNNVAASALCVMVNGTTTSIKSINGAVVESNAPVYNLQGQRVDGNNLTPGIYVKAGKKFVVR